VDQALEAGDLTSGLVVKEGHRSAIGGDFARHPDFDNL
jgi:hypothetical protein